MEDSSFITLLEILAKPTKSKIIDFGFDNSKDYTQYETAWFQIQVTPEITYYLTFENRSVYLGADGEGVILIDGLDGENWNELADEMFVEQFPNEFTEQDYLDDLADLSIKMQKEQ